MTSIKEMERQSLISQNRLSLIQIPAISEWEMVERVAREAADEGLNIEQVNVETLTRIAKTARDQIMQKAVEEAERQLGIL